MDNYGTHKTPSIKGWLARHPRFKVHFAGSVNSDHIFSGNSDHLGGPAEAPGRTPANDPTGGKG